MCPQNERRDSFVVLGSSWDSGAINCTLSGAFVVSWTWNTFCAKGWAKSEKFLLLLLKLFAPNSIPSLTTLCDLRIHLNLWRPSAHVLMRTQPYLNKLLVVQSWVELSCVWDLARLFGQLWIEHWIVLLWFGSEKEICGDVIPQRVSYGR